MPKLKWTLETCKEEALQYLSRTEFTKWSSGAYNKVCKEGWLDVICKDMIKEAN